MNDSYIKQLHAELLSIMDCIHEVCVNNDIKYYLVGGSLLGAVRHGGFIPWDDDFDIGMPRKDFEKFISVCETQLPPNLGLVWATTYKNYWYPFAKVHNKNTIFVESGYVGVEEKTGIYVDIFPIDSVPEYNKDIEKRKKKIKLINRIMHDKVLNVKPETFKAKMLSLYASPRDIAQWHKKQTTIMKQTNSENCKYSANFASYYAIKKQVMPWNWYGAGKLISFEGHMFLAPDEEIEVLKSIYGENYMELPPADKRRTHYPSYVKFTDGVEMNFKITR